MAALMFVVPDETARILRELKVPKGTPEQNSHITVVHLGDDVSIDRIAEVVPILYDVTFQTLPFSVSTNRITTFSAGKDGVPVIAAIESQELHDFRGELCRALDEAGQEYSKKFPIYKPHVTLTYAQDPATRLDLSIPKISWACHELLLWGSNRGDGRLVVKFPLSLPIGRVATGLHAPEQAEIRRLSIASASHKALVKLALWRSLGHKTV